MHSVTYHENHVYLSELENIESWLCFSQQVLQSRLHNGLTHHLAERLVLLASVRTDGRLVTVSFYRLPPFELMRHLLWGMCICRVSQLRPGALFTDSYLLSAAFAKTHSDGASRGAEGGCFITDLTCSAHCCQLFRWSTFTPHTCSGVAFDFLDVSLQMIVVICMLNKPVTFCCHICQWFIG